MICMPQCLTCMACRLYLHRITISVILVFSRYMSDPPYNCKDVCHLRVHGACWACPAWWSEHPQQAWTVSNKTVQSHVADEQLFAPFLLFAFWGEATRHLLNSHVWVINQFALAFVWHHICLCIALDCNTILYCCCTSDDLRSSRLAVTLNTFEVQPKPCISHVWMIAWFLRPCLSPLLFIPSRPFGYDQV